MADQQLQKRLLTRFLSKDVPPIPHDDERIIYPEKLNPFSWLFFWWLHPVMKTGYKRTLVVDDLFKLNEKVKVEALNDTFESHMYSAIDKAKAEHLRSKKSQRSESERISPEKDMKDFRHPRFVALWALIKTFPLQYGLACFFMILTNCAGACNPLLARKLIEFVQRKTGDDNVNNGKGVGYALGCSFMVLAVGILFNHAFMNSMLTGCQAKGVLIKSILNKSFRLSGASRVKYPSSKITALMGMDVSRIEFALGWQPILIAFPFSLGISIGILIYNIGSVSLVGVGMILVYLVVISFAVSRVYRFRIRANKYTDIRVGLVKEILNNLKAIKFYCWEDAYEKQVIETRSQEMKYVLRMQQTRSLVVGTSVCMTLFASMTSFLTLYATSGSTRDPASLFSSISLFNNLASQIIVLPAALSSGSDAIIGIMRLSEYFAAEEGSDIKEQRSFQEKSTLAVSITNASFKWDGSSGGNDETVSVSSALTDDKASTSSCTPMSTKFDGLRDINLSIAHGQFVVVTGMIGSGKSALLNSIAGFIPLASGHLSVEGSLLLCEHHWIQNTTVKENILFGKEYDEKRYNDTLYACSLESDLEILPAGDQTEIGERGITLSGGQKARISLARAVYADNDIILLDDVLSAVDAKVAKHIMTNCVLGLLATKTRILATHQISLIGSSDMVVFLNGDGTIDHGTMEDLKQRNTNFRNLMALGANTKTPAEANDSDEEEVEGRQDKESETNETNDSEAVRKNFNVNMGEDGKLTKEERRAVNSIKFDVYKRYIKNGSGIFPVFSVAIFVFMSEVLAHVCEIMTNTWLSFWADYRFRHKGDHFYIGIYIMFTFCAYFFLIFAFLALAYLTNTSAEVLNLKAMHRVLHAPMSLMDVTPMGRLLNRFTKDSDVLDNEINNDLRVLIYFIGSIFGILVLCIIYLPYFAIAVPFLGFLFVAIGNFYQASAREIKRLEAVQRSFVYNNFNEILSGMMTIKAYNAEARFKRKNDVYINKTNEASYLTVANQRWLSIHLDIVASLFAVIISLLCVFRVFKISAASTGLLLSYVLSIAGSLSVLIRTLTQVENQMNSVERLCEYGFDLEQEAPYVISETKPSPTWPNEGAISFENVSLAYRPNLPLVLKNLTLDVKPYEKIGICGRTGAGKSSIMTALYRLVELKEGKIEIDGADISKLGLKDLRSHLSIIPQDPVLFKGTIRKNLDPFDNFTEAELWKSLVSAGLVNESEVETAQTNQDIKFHLKKEVEENGVNFSLGERQLLAFARALVRKTKVFILDEATSSVDYKTDNRIQQTIAEHFNRCTVLCIAHRLKTILSYDRIIVLDNGEIVECGTPKDLYMITDSNFRQMCEKSGISDKDFV